MQIIIIGQNLSHDAWQRVLPQLPDNSVDLVVTDPPYGTTNLEFDKLKVDWKDFLEQMNRVCKPNAPQILFASGKFVPELLNSNLKNFRYELIWEKSIAVGFLDANRRPLRAHEQMLVFCQQWRGSPYNPQMTVGKAHKRGGNKRKPSHYAGLSKEVPETETNLYHPRSALRFDSAVRGSKSLHPTAKPLELVKWLVQSFSNRGGVVLDPFVGSGTTLAACALTGRRGIGVELNEQYFKVAQERLRQIEAEENGKRD